MRISTWQKINGLKYFTINKMSIKAGSRTRDQIDVIIKRRVVLVSVAFLLLFFEKSAAFVVWV